MRGVSPHVDGITIPGLQGDQRRAGTVAYPELDIARKRGGSAVLQNDRGSAERRDLDDQMRSGGLCVPRERDVGATDRLCRERDHVDTRGPDESLRGHDVSGNERCTDTRILSAHLLDGEALCLDAHIKIS